MIGFGSVTAERLAIRLMIGQGILFAAETAAIHHIGLRASVTQLALVRGVAGLTLAVVLARHLGFAVFKTRQLALQLARGGVAALYLWVMLYSFGHLPFADATAISYTQAAYIALFSALILGERVTGMRWAAAAIGIGGALLIAKPAFADWHGAYLVALLGTSLNGLAFVLNKYLQREDSETTTMFYTNLVPVLLNIPALATAGLPSPEIVPWLPALFLLGPIGMYFGIVAVKHANASLLGPYTLLRLVVGLVGAVVVFGELPDIYSAVGAGLILGSCVLSSRGSMQRRRFPAHPLIALVPRGRRPNPTVQRPRTAVN